MLECPFCLRNNFGSQGALTQHQQRSPVCLAKLRASLAGKSDYLTAHQYIPRSTAKNGRCSSETLRPPPAKKMAINGKIVWTKSQKFCAKLQKSGKLQEHQLLDCSKQLATEDNDEFNFLFGTLDENVQRPGQIDTSILDDYRDYCADANRDYVPLTDIQKAAITLLATLRRTKASLSTYESMMEWHLRSTGVLRPHETFKNTDKYLTRKKLYEDLRWRYNMPLGRYALVKDITLPHSKAKVRIVFNAARSVIQSLLTDPRIRDEDYMFFDNDPFAPPPDDLDYIADFNTGLSYIETYKKLITNPNKQILIGFPIYIDGTETGQFAHLPITAVKIGHGLMNRKARDNDDMWRTLGYIPGFSKVGSRGRHLFLQSGHVDGIMAHQDVSDDEGNLDTVFAEKSQDFHTMLDAVLEEFVEIQNSGFTFDLYYRKVLYKDVEFIPFVPFIKCDNDEADKLCGSYSCRTGGVKQLCRYCYCPTEKSNRPLADFAFKTIADIQALIDAEDFDGLRAISQQYIENATYKLRFGMHNDRGVHGACPMEMLHTLLLGIFKYIRDCFFDQIGPTSAMADDVNALAKEYGDLLSRQSDRDMPKTRFSGGIRKGKLMAKEYPGILLCMAAVLRSTAGQRMLTEQKCSQFKATGVLKDWTLLVEIMLQWEMWLKSDRMLRSHVQRAKAKHRYIMYLMKKVGRRSKGMGLKIMKFHGIMHVAMDIEYYGVPMEVDTGSNESGHKKAKTAAKVTQKVKGLFDEQTCKRLHEVHLLELANEEIAGRPPWRYPNGYVHPADEPPPADGEPRLGGAKLHCYYDEEVQRNVFRTLHKRKGDDDITLENELIDFVVKLQDLVSAYQESVHLRSNHYRNGEIFRGDTLFLGGVWRDWAMVDWGNDGGILPNKVWGFVDLSCLPSNSGINFGGVTDLSPGLYAIVETAVYSKNKKEKDMSELFVPIRKQVRGLRHGYVQGMKFYLADVEAIVEPAVVVPDIGGNANAYFLVRNRCKWSQMFTEWLDFPDEEDDMESEEESNDENYDEGSVNSSNSND